MIKFGQSQALTSHFESFWSIVHCNWWTYLLIILVCPLLNVFGPVVLEPGSRWLLEVFPPTVLATVLSDVSWNWIHLQDLKSTMWKLQKFTLKVFDKTFVKSTFLQKKLLKSWFCKISLVSEFLAFPYYEIWVVTEKIFCEINSLETSLTKTLLLRTFCQ